MKWLPNHLARTKERNSGGAQRGAHCCKNSNIVLILNILFAIKKYILLSSILPPAREN